MYIEHETAARSMLRKRHIVAVHRFTLANVTTTCSHSTYLPTKRIYSALLDNQQGLWYTASVKLARSSVYSDTPCEYNRYSSFWQERRHMRMPKASATQPPLSSRPLGKIEVLPNAIHSIAVQAASECYGVLGIASPRLHNGQAVLLSPEQSNQGVRVTRVNKQLVIEIYVVLEYGLRISEIAHNIMSGVKFSTEKMLGLPVAQVNVNVQGLIHGPTLQTKKD
jgi:uncharacterized alkaline shock family protein YloU